MNRYAEQSGANARQHAGSPMCARPGCVVALDPTSGALFCFDHEAEGTVDKSIFSSSQSPRRGLRRETPVAGPVGVLRLVTAHLLSVFPRQSTPRQIAFETGQSHDAVKKALSREAQWGSRLVERTERGRYRARVDADLMRAVDIGDPEVHNLAIRFPWSPSAPGGAIAMAFAPQSHERHYWRGRKVTVQFNAGTGHGRGHLRPHIIVYLQATRLPLGLQELDAYLEHLTGFMLAYGVDLHHPEVRVHRWETNVDIALRRIALLGPAVTLHKFRTGFIKVYNKRELGVMRSEVCEWPVDLTPDEAVGVLEQAFMRNRLDPLPLSSGSRPPKIGGA